MIRTSMLWPDMLISRCWIGSLDSPAVTNLQSNQVDTRVIDSETGCSTWMRAFTSMK